MKTIRCDYEDKCPGHATPDERPCGYVPTYTIADIRLGRPKHWGEKSRRKPIVYAKVVDQDGNVAVSATLDYCARWVELELRKQQEKK